MCLRKRTGELVNFQEAPEFNINKTCCLWCSRYWRQRVAILVLQHRNRSSRKASLTITGKENARQTSGLTENKNLQKNLLAYLHNNRNFLHIINRDILQQKRRPKAMKGDRGRGRKAIRILLIPFWREVTLISFFKRQELPAPTGDRWHLRPMRACVDAFLTSGSAAFSGQLWVILVLFNNDLQFKVKKAWIGKKHYVLEGLKNTVENLSWRAVSWLRCVTGTSRVRGRNEPGEPRVCLYVLGRNSIPRLLL